MKDNQGHGMHVRNRIALARSRGVAMLLVLIALSVGTILSAAALTSRDNSPAIGRNAGKLTAANWAADAGANYAVAVLESTRAWRARGDGVILEDYPLARARVDTTVTNLDGGAPTLTDREILVRSVALVEGVSATVERRVSLSLPKRVFQPVDPFVGEFAIFANESLRIEGDARVRSDHRSPEATTLLPIKIGMGFSAAADLRVDPDARLRGVLFVLDSGSSTALRQTASGYRNVVGVEDLPLNVPAIPGHLPAAFGLLENVINKNLELREGRSFPRWDPLNEVEPTIEAGGGEPQASAMRFGGRGAGLLIRAIGASMLGQVQQTPGEAIADENTADANNNNPNANPENNANPANNANPDPGEGAWIYSSSTTLPVSGRYERIRVRDAAVLTIDESNGRFYEAWELILDTGAVLLIRGKVILHLEYDLRATQGSTIEFADENSALVVYIGRHLLVSDSGFGVDRSHGRDPLRDPANLMAYTRPQQLRILGLDNTQGGFRNPSYEIRDNALVVGCIHVPHGSVEIREQSAIVGQVVADDFILRQGSSLLYDPRLDSRSGYAHLLGPLYQASGETVTSVQDVLSDPTLDDGAAIIAQMVNLQLAQEWQGAEDWTVEDTDSSVGDIEVYYDGFKTYQVVDDSTQVQVKNSSLLTTETAMLSTVEISGSGGGSGGSSGGGSTQLEESAVLNTGRTPTRRTPGRVEVSAVPRAARALEGGH